MAMSDFQEVYRLYFKDVYKYVLSLSKNQQLAEEMTALDNLYLFSSMKGSHKDDADYYLEKFGLTEHKKKKVRKFSIGMRRRLQLAICLSYKADLYVLDEPFSGLDYQAVELLENMLLEIKERGASMIISSHQSEPLERIRDRSYTMINLNQLK